MTPDATLVARIATNIAQTHVEMIRGLADTPQVHNMSCERALRDVADGLERALHSFLQSIRQ